MTRVEFEKLDAFDKLRNKIVHKLIVNNHQLRKRSEVTRTDLDAGFNESRKNCENFLGQRRTT
jgi:hypothetical protein